MRTKKSKVQACEKRSRRKLTNYKNVPKPKINSHLKTKNNGPLVAESNSSSILADSGSGHHSDSESMLFSQHSTSSILKYLSPPLTSSFSSLPSQFSKGPCIAEASGREVRPSVIADDRKPAIPFIRKRQSKQKKSENNRTFEVEELEEDFTSQLDLAIEDRNFPVFYVTEWGLTISVLPHPATVSIVGCQFVQVVSGVVQIHGHKLDQSSDMLPVCSVNNVFCVNIKTVKSDNICRQAARLQLVKKKLIEIKATEDVADKILNSCNNASVILAFRKNFKCADIRFMTRLMPDLFHLNLKKKKDIGPTGIKDLGFKLYVESSSTVDYPECENFVKDVISSIRDAAEDNSDSAPRIVVQGRKGLGKSTFLKYIINRALNEFEAVFYLDGDIGQCEFTPAGCVSLVKVTKPLLGPAFSHQTMPEKMYFLGAVNVSDVYNDYSQSIRLLIDFYMEKFSSLPLFVNTMGFVTGLGLELLEQLKERLSPTHVVEIIDDQLRGSHRTPVIPLGPETLNQKTFTFNRFSTLADKKNEINARDRRDLSILAYLGKCQKTFIVSTLNSITPYGVLWKDIALYVFDQKLAQEYIFYVINGSWVALMSVDDSLIMETDHPTFPKFLCAKPVGCECIGFGVVRGIDLSKKMLYIITPEPKERLKRVNAIVKGNIELPGVLYTQQDCKKTPLYVAQFEGKSCPASKGIKRRIPLIVKDQQTDNSS